MDNLNEIRTIIQSVLEDYAQIPYRYGDVETIVIVDADRNNFLLMVIGWERHRRVHGCITHVQIIENKVWIQRDGIEDGITDELVAAGIPKEQIVLGFHPPDVRQHTGYAVA